MKIKENIINKDALNQFGKNNNDFSIFPSKRFLKTLKIYL